MPGSFLNLELLESCENQNQDFLEYRNKPFANSDVFLCSIENSVKRSCGEDVPEILELELFCENISSYSYFCPGEAVGILPNNPPEEVDTLIELLGIEDISNKNYKLSFGEQAGKKKVLKHIPPSGKVRDIFLKHIDIRSPPKKVLLKSLLPYTDNPEEHAALELMCSPKGSKKYYKFLKQNTGFVHLLKAFPSCRPPLEVILEHSVPLQPRFYSVASYPLINNNFKIIFNVVKIGDNITGICSGFLKRCIESSESNSNDNTIPVYFRKSTDFCYGGIFREPSLLIATGTGFAPFLSFFDYEEWMNSENRSEYIRPEMWVYYGCRYKNSDNLSRSLDKFVETGFDPDRLCNAYSRETNEKHYIQDKIGQDADIICDFIDRGAKIFVCGNKDMEKSVREAIIGCFQSVKEIDDLEARSLLEDLEDRARYVAEFWH